jgi:peptidoglycan/LPS O-acetylase OafA/YrhL
MIVKGARAHNNFTLLRLGLAWLVFMGHFHLLAGEEHPAWPFTYADFSVDSFFVVSGYLITLSFDKDGSLRRFYIRRLFRLYPLYLTMVLLQAMLMVALLPADTPQLGYQAARYIVLNSFFCNFLQYDIGHLLAAAPNPGINPSLWTLKVEVGFYLVLPFLWMAVRRFGDWVMLAVFAASALYAYSLQAAGMHSLSQQLPGQLQYFVLGMALYRYGDRLPARGWGWLLAIPLLATYATLEMRTPLLYPLVVAALVFAIACRTRAVNFHLDLSYGVYLVHGPLIQFALLLGIYQNSPIGFLFAALGVLGLAVIAEALVERPFIAIGRRLSQRSVVTPAMSPANG